MSTNDSGNDTISRLLQRARGKPGSATPPPPVTTDEEGEEEHFSYAKLRGLRQKGIMLECRTADGNSDAFDYGWLRRARFDPSAGIELQFGGDKVAIAGKNLRPLYEAITAHRVTWVAVLPQPETIRDPEATIVTAIVVESNGR